MDGTCANVPVVGYCLVPGTSVTVQPDPHTVLDILLYTFIVFP